MARTRSNNQTPAPAPEAPEIDAAPVEALFEIKVNRVVKSHGTTFRPMHTYVVKEKVKTELGDAVASAVPAPLPPS